MTGSDNEWFAGADSPFLEALKRLAPERLAGLLQPDDTTSYLYPFDPTMERDLRGSLAVAQVRDVPALGAKASSSLQVLSHRGALCGYWSDDLLWDDFNESHPESLVVQGRPLSDADAATLALEWLARQMVRPVELREWQSKGVTVARAWVLADTDTEVGTEGPRRKRRGAPSRTELIRPVTTA